MTKPITVEDDPRLKISDADRRASFEIQSHLNELYASLQEARKAITRITDQAKGIKASETDKEPPAALKPAIDSLVKRATEIDDKLTGTQRQAARPSGTANAAPVRPPSGTGGAARTGEPAGESGQQGEADAPRPRGQQAGGYAGRITQLINSIDSVSELPSDYARGETKAIAKDLQQIVKEINELNDRGLADLNRQLRDQNLKAVEIPARIATPR